MNESLNTILNSKENKEKTLNTVGEYAISLTVCYIQCLTQDQDLVAISQFTTEIENKIKERISQPEKEQTKNQPKSELNSLENLLSKGEHDVYSMIRDEEITDITTISNKLNTSESAIYQRLSQIYTKFGISGKGPGKLSRLKRIIEK